MRISRAFRRIAARARRRAEKRVRRFDERLLLAQAILNACITRREAREILQCQRSELQISAGIALGVLEHAVQLGYLSEAETLQLRDQVSRCSNLTSHWEIVDTHLNVQTTDDVRPSTIRRATGVALLVALASFVCWALNLASLGRIGAIASIVALILMLLFPDGLRGNFAWYASLRFLFLAAGAVVILVSWATIAGYAWAATLVSVFVELDEQGSMVALATCIVLVNLVLILSLLAVARFRRWEIASLRASHDTLSRLVSQVRRQLRGRKLPDADEVIDNLLAITARTMQSNPWAYLLKRLLFWRPAVGAVTIWYLTPDRSEAGVVRSFSIHSWQAVPDAPTSVREAMRVLQERHHPVALDQARYDDALAECRHASNGRLDTKRFIRRPDRTEFISLTGYVFSERRVKYEPYTCDCLALDESYLVFLDGRPSRPEVRAWLDFQSVAAYPVFGSSTIDEPVGVVVGFSNLPNGITPEARRALLVASHLIGAVVAWSTKKTAMDAAS